MGCCYNSLYLSFAMVDVKLESVFFRLVRLLIKKLKFHVRLLLYNFSWFHRVCIRLASRKA